MHHAFTSIHPFEDDNGCVARALASIEFIRAGMFPLLIDRSDKHSEYIPALERADADELERADRIFLQASGTCRAARHLVERNRGRAAQWHGQDS
jgi:Fic family protein